MNEDFDAQDQFEKEGAAAGLAGKHREDCPYDKVTQASAWNFWVYGLENAKGEQRVIAEGFNSALTSTAATSLPEPKIIPAEEAYRSGLWKPQHVTIPSSWAPSSTLRSS